MIDDRGPNQNLAPSLPTIGDVSLPEERRAHLAPLLRTLLDDFARLEELEEASLEPSTIFRPWEEVVNERG